ncbi:MAG: TonB family protein [Gemmatimonadales bacterium]
MFETLLESGRRRSLPSRQAAVSFTLHASALIGAVALSHPPSRVGRPLVRPVEPIVVFTEAATPVVPGIAVGSRGVSIPVAPLLLSSEPAAAPAVLPVTTVALPGADINVPAPDLRALFGIDQRLRIESPSVARESETPPELVLAVRPVYPEFLRWSGVTGQVVVEFVVDSTGRLLESSLRIVSADHPGFVGPARMALRQSCFRPGRVGGAAVPVWVRQTVRFELDRAGS